MTSKQTNHATAAPATTAAQAVTVTPAITAAQEYLLMAQHDDGHWCAELEGDTILESEYILTLYFVGREAEDPKLQKAAEYIRRKQEDHGGWAMYPGGPPDVSASTKAYFVLKLLGDEPDASHMRKARAAIRAAGGIDACNTYTKIYLALFGQYDWARCPAIPPEMILLPSWVYFNIYEMSSWTRTIVVPLSIIWALKPTHAVPSHAQIDELYTEEGPPPPVNAPTTAKEYVWYTAFQLLDGMLKQAEQIPIKPLRARALREAEAWTLRRLRKSDGLGAIFPPIINTIIALYALGYDVDDPILRGQIAELEALDIEENDTLRVQPCKSPVWDTSQVLTSLLASGLPHAYEALRRAGRWLLDKEVQEEGDWVINNPSAPLGGWYFEYANEFYPDIDDTAEVLLGLHQLRYEDEIDEARREAAVERGLEWLLAMQNDDGGWAAFDKGCDKEIFTYVPFADHNAMLDPSCEDITGRVLETLSAFGYDRTHPVVRRAAAYLRRTQEPDGTWYGRWGANYIYGTWLALSGLAAVGEDMSQDRYQRAGAWLRTHQNDDGGWGESLATYDDPAHKGCGRSTASQTAWALLTLMALGDTGSDALRRGIDYLLRTQQDDGAWHDEDWTGTGFPRVFYLRYHYYAVYFPLLALATYRKMHAAYHDGKLSHAAG